VAKASEAEEDAGAARIVARARKKLPMAARCCRRMSWIAWPTGKIRYVCCANGVAKPRCTCPSKQI